MVTGGTEKDGKWGGQRKGVRRPGSSGSACSELARPAALCCAGAEASMGRGRWRVAASGRWGRRRWVGQRRGTAGIELCSASCCAWEERREGRRREGGRKRKEKRKKRKREKGKRKMEREKERERERAVGGIRGGGRPRARCGVRPVSDEHAELEKGKGDRTAIGTGVGTVDRLENFWEKQDLG